MSVNPGVKAWGLAAAMIAIVGVAPARAEEVVTATVPFDFIVGQMVMPAGKYVISEPMDPAIVAVRSADGRHFSFVLTIPDSPNDSAVQPELVFDRIGARSFLVQIVTGSDNIREIPLTDAMKGRVIDRVAVALDSTPRAVASR
jgi:hypothetical protein